MNKTAKSPQVMRGSEAADCGIDAASSMGCTGLMAVLARDYDEWQAFGDLQRLMPGVIRRK